MNYIKQIRFLWTKAKRHSLGAGEIAMYFYLLEISNVHDWENPVMEPNATLQHAIGVKSFNTLKEIRNKLQQFGLVRFKSRNGSNVVEYDLFDVERQTFSKFDEVGEKVTDEVTDEVGEKVTAEVIENTIVLYKHKPKPKHLNNSSGDVSVKSFSLRGFPVKKNAGDYLMEKFEPRIEQEFMKNFRQLEMEDILLKFTEESFMKPFKDDTHLFNSFIYLCRKATAENKLGSKQNSEILKNWGG